ncbi:hypothetical protein CCACVL1_29184 [Corchorus capsularis]|uniref:HTH myb-type domain-containing protein n=1 Tax=Corchorus capsularis TaxID=210143 RepID=A0A1R3G3A8_COCAP|nr:hypothetical protein CCACVL1_29184 [Corchorus capsularis]
MTSASSSGFELNLSLKPSYVPKTIANLLKDLSNVDNEADKLAVLNDYINQLEEELNRIVPIKHQFPQCMLLLMEALQALRDEFVNIKNGKGSDETARGKHGSVVAIRRKHYEEEKIDKLASVEKDDCKGKSSVRSNSSHQLWNSTNYEHKKHKSFIDFIQAPIQIPISCKGSASILPSLVGNGCSSKEIIGGSCSKSGSIGTNNGLYGMNLKADTLNYQPRPLTQPIWKNNRRSWSAELHSRFVEALHLLGGIEVATPKQIKEIMQVEGLTNDQVKSHLQKYRLHSRKQSAKYRENLVNFQDPWHPQMYYGDPNLSPDQDSDDHDEDNSNNPQA